MNHSPWYFSPWQWIYGVKVEVDGASGGPRGRGRAQGVGRAPTLVNRWWPPAVDLPSSIYYIFLNNSPLIFSAFRELLFLHKNNTMEILLKTASVRVSSIQIMQVRVQTKGRSVWKSRYNGDVSTPPSLNLCLSSSNSVDKLRWQRQTFTNSVCSCCCKYVKPAFKFSAKIIN